MRGRRGRRSYKLRLISAQVHGDDVLGDARLASAARLCDRLRQATKRELNLETSAGVSTSKLLAKTVAGLHKPFQQTVLADTPRITGAWCCPTTCRCARSTASATARRSSSRRRASPPSETLRDFSGPSSISDIERLRALARGDDASPSQADGRAQVHRRRGVVLDEAARRAVRARRRRAENARAQARAEARGGPEGARRAAVRERPALGTRAAERSGSPRALTSTLAEGPASAQREKTPGREAKSRPARARVGTLTDDAACEALASKLEADAAALLTALYPHGATLSILNLGVTLKTIDAAGHADISSFLTKRKAPAPRPPPPVPAPVAPPSPGASTTGIDGAEVDPQTLSELPPEIRADIERQLALWRKTRRPPAKKPRRSSSGMDAFLSPPPPPAVDEAAVAQIVAMGFSRKSAVAALERVNGDVQRAIDGLLASS